MSHLSDSFMTHQIASKFLKPNKKIVDLVGFEVMKASENVRHIIMPCSSSARSQVIPDIIRHHSRLVNLQFVDSLVKLLPFSHLMFYIFSVEDALLFSLRRRIIVLNYLDYWLELGLFMVTFSSLCVR